MQPLTEAYYNSADTQGKAAATMHQWVEDYLHEAKQQDRSDEERRRLMNATNPKYLLRNYLAQLAIDDAEQGDYKQVDTLLEILRHPYDEQPEFQNYAEKRPEWARNRAGCSMLSCSS